MSKLRDWPTDALDVSGSGRRGRVELNSCARACPRRKMSLTSGPGALETPSASASLGYVVQ